MDEMSTRVGEGVAEGMARGRVIDVSGTSVRVLPAGAEDGVDCDVLRSSGPPPLVLPGDEVLVWVGSGGRGVVLGLVESPSTSAPALSDTVQVEIAPEERASEENEGDVVPATGTASPESDAVPDRLVLEARESLTLRVGEGSIVLRGDGKIVIKGRDLLSRATRSHRIKGGSVGIN